MNSLADLAIKKVAECIIDGTYDTLDYQLIPYHCDKVVSEILKSGNGWKNRVIRHLMDRNFMLSNLDFEDFRFNETGQKFLRNQKFLRFLSIGDLENCEDGENESFNIVKFLEKSVNLESQRILLKLNISGTKQFSNGWIENLSRMFPLLLEFSISGRQILGNSGNLFFKFFPNLIRLDLGGTNIKKLDGIKKLKNLEWLSLKDLDFESSEDIQEIFELKNLKFLDLSATRRNPDQRIIEKYLECQKNLDSLEIFDCSGTDLDRFSLQSLELTHGNLKIVIAMETSIGTSTIPDSRLQILNSGTFENQIKTLDYYFESKNRTGICWCLHYLKEMLKEGDVENIPECFQKILEALKRFGRFNDVKKFGIECLIEFKGLFCYAPQIGRTGGGFLRSTLIKSKQAFRNVSVVETKRESYKLKNASWKDLKAILSLAGPYKWRILLGISFLGVSSTIFLLTPRVLGKLIDEWDETKQDKMDQTDKSLLLARYFKENPVALVGVLMLGALAIAARIYCMHTAGQLVINDLRKTVFNSVLRQDMAFFDKNKVGEIVSRLSTDALIVGYSVSMNLSDGARALLTCLGSGGLMVYTSLAMCKVIVVVVPVIVGTFAVFGKLQRKYTLMMQEAVAGANQVATERLSSVRTVRMLVAEKKELAAYSDKINEIWLISKMEGLAKGCMFGSFQFTGYLALSSILFYGSNLISQGLLTYGELSSFCLYAVLSAGSLSAMSGFYLELMKGLGASSRLFELKDREPKIPLEGGIQKGNVQEAIRFEHVAFGYADRDPLFHNISFDVPAGKITAVVGSSGSGKSTIASLLLRLYDPTNGRILVDGVDLKDLDPSYWRRHIGTVGQEPVLFSTTIRDNIIYGSTEPEKVSEADIVSAAEQSNADEFIMRFPQKYDTKVGEHGSTLSGGQKQRIAIARALVNKPNILIMDEATSALDASSEYLVRIALNKLLANSKQTVMIIAHRLSTIKHADQIVVVDKGSVAECGSYEELIQIPDGIFRKLVEKQTFGFKDQDSY
ncbi:hypothetical protein B9Z55_021123 [Caenorhabditis nigoni]|uniref:Uncharacterized protein n=1 Tax=Caenorhabditis nigoni TaxID=1611254 RepID=A0A2G5TQK1_9PELO|nr:hypothetical protein B9Z55_021123 [Caenorhabditis nigoni]